MPTEKFTFKSSQGHTLSARLDIPDGPHVASALFAHCFTCSKDIPAARRISQRLASQGIAVLRFDFTGLGHSDGEFANTGFSTNLEDLKAAAQALRHQGYSPDILIGHSLGGAAVIAVAGDIPEAKAVVTIGAPFAPGHVTENFGHKKTEIAEIGQAEVCLGGRPFTIKQSFLTDIAQYKLDAALKSLGKALLVLHAPRDAIVSVDNAAALFTAAKHPKSFVTLDDANHLITNPKDAEYTAEVIASWVTRYLDFHTPAPPPGAPEGITRISETDPGGFLQDIMSGPDHHSLADEPEAYGGTNKGMSPYGFVSAGLGACTSMTLRMYARRKGWPLEHISVDVSHDKVHAQDARAGASEKIDRFQRIIKLRGPLSDEQRQTLLEIADKCPVHRTLERSNQIETRLGD
ncbi:bifunctional alpha/beta hydrolase/OsmC family protein [Lentibacter sp.]|uniref:bifunctional alpha/beta hydrolase/OsmC family protein n=1 Tax=Lentibacter sp. TaxID=2024994 RepID=UPI003F6B52AE